MLDGIAKKLVMITIIAAPSAITFSYYKYCTCLIQVLYLSYSMCCIYPSFIVNNLFMSNTTIAPLSIVITLLIENDKYCTVLCCKFYSYL